MTSDKHTHASLARSLRIFGYCTLAALAIALFVAMCAILRDSALDREAAQRAPNDSLELHGSTGSSPDAAPETPAAHTPG
ncbi:hypothetical protein [Burkholderia perseverans]|uniref:hypothetical protein n=1 Tax=Burkholderia perseverans TaxID=2615214 RepID=UPI001FEF0CFE|nr:hypothetical protein [Burkholderia perseverans]